MAAAQRFPKRHRLLQHAEFERVYRNGRRHASAHMVLFFLPAERAAGNSGAGPRVGFTVGRVLGNAVLRNRIRRRVREAVRRHLSSLEAAVDVVINPRKSANAADFAQLEKEVANAFAVVARACAPGK